VFRCQWSVGLVQCRRPVQFNSQMKRQTARAVLTDKIGLKSSHRKHDSSRQRLTIRAAFVRHRSSERFLLS
jgi:hypothetical protein